MNADELARNPQLTEWTVHDLNADPILPYGDNEFDAATIAVSVQYLTKPLEVFQEIARVLKPEAPCIVSFSNRCFPTKATSLWQSLGDEGHIQLTGTYLHYAKAFNPPKWQKLDTAGDPMYIVWSEAKSIAE